MLYFLAKPTGALLERRLMKKIFRSFGPLAILSACGSSAPGSGGFLSEVPEEVVALAAPNQNLQAVKLLDEDNCYWYQHIGPVETTMLPLLSNRGRRICIQSPT